MSAWETWVQTVAMLVLVATASWRISARLSTVEAKLDLLIQGLDIRVQPK